MPTHILGLETSCDETAASVVRDDGAILSNVVSSQHDLHERFGGVVPEIASRAHLERLLPVVRAAAADAGLTLGQVDAIGVGNRPGLIGSLIVGTSAAKALAWSLNKPLLGIDHVQAHLYAARLHEPSQGTPMPLIRYPALGLVVSGGHTSLYAVQSPLQMQLLGRTIDDAVGEAYDKAAVILGAGYPGGPNIDKLARQGTADPHRFPQSMLGKTSLDFSFSGLKTALLYAVRGKPAGRGKDAHFEQDHTALSQQERADLAASFQHAVVATILKKVERATYTLTDQAQNPKSILVGGGVSANSLLRERLGDYALQNNTPLHLPELPVCVDNAAMIAGLAHERLKHGEQDDLSLPVIATTALN
ncbi:MAG: tRNA (adenosine(37)-N6)-threonylcarbamoyltransferase complex transferase subunit TsaD [Planctomycetota bacterium]